MSQVNNSLDLRVKAAVRVWRGVELSVLRGTRELGRAPLGVSASTISLAVFDKAVQMA